MTESTIGLYKTELIYRHRPWKTPEQVATLEYIDWWNKHRPHTDIGDCSTPGMGNHVIPPLGNCLTLLGLSLGNHLIADRALRQEAADLPEPGGAGARRAEMGLVFGDEVLASAILDRLLHHAEVISINVLPAQGQDARAEGRR